MQIRQVLPSHSFYSLTDKWLPTDSADPDSSPSSNSGTITGLAVRGSDVGLG